MPTESEEHDLVTCVKWRPDARRHILAHKYGTTKLWDSTCAKLISQYQSPTGVFQISSSCSLSLVSFKNRCLNHCALWRLVFINLDMSVRKLKEIPL